MIVAGVLLFLLSLAFFLGLHVIARRRWRTLPFTVALKLSRGAAALALALAGFASLITWFELWPQGFLRSAAGPMVLIPTVYVLGHLVADFLWLAYGARREQAPPRIDLVLHHLLGLIVCLLVLRLGVGGETVGVVLTTEMMPVTTGLMGWARLRGWPRMEALAAKLRLATLLFWRLPLWFVLTFRIGGNLMSGAVAASRDEALLLVHQLALGALGVIFVLDTFWTVVCWRGLRRA